MRQKALSVQIHVQLMQLVHLQTVCSGNLICGLSPGFTELSEVVLPRAKDYGLGCVSERGSLPGLLHQAL